jgi:hypothetical protein
VDFEDFRVQSVNVSGAQIPGELERMLRAADIADS